MNFMSLITGKQCSILKSLGGTYFKGDNGGMETVCVCLSIYAALQTLTFCHINALS